MKRQLRWQKGKESSKRLHGPVLPPSPAEQSEMRHHQHSQAFVMLSFLHRLDDD